jgi:hypothetical protein
MKRVLTFALLLGAPPIDGLARAAPPTAAAIAALPQPSEYVAPAPEMLQATTVRRYAAPDAEQGVAVDATHFYAINNTVIDKYEIASGRLEDRWMSPFHGLIRHLNSCVVRNERLICANSNYNIVPMGSSIEYFDTKTMKHVDSHSLGLTDEGSLTWVEPYQQGWLTAFAQYDGHGGLPFKDHRYASVVTFDTQWRRTGGWLFPDDILQRMAPHAASGGSIGPDGLLYVIGHDLPEMYVLARPAMGPTLIHVATIALEAQGEAFAWAPGRGRTIFTVDHHKGRVLEIQLPLVTVTNVDALPFHPGAHPHP